MQLCGGGSETVVGSFVAFAACWPCSPSLTYAHLMQRTVYAFRGMRSSHAPRYHHRTNCEIILAGDRSTNGRRLFLQVARTPPRSPFRKGCSRKGRHHKITHPCGTNYYRIPHRTFGCAQAAVGRRSGFLPVRIINRPGSISGSSIPGTVARRVGRVPFLRVLAVAAVSRRADMYGRLCYSGMTCHRRRLGLDGKLSPSAGLIEMKTSVRAPRINCGKAEGERGAF